MKKQFSLKVLMMATVAVTALFLASCAKSGYKNAIPADAPLVMELDVKTVALKAEFMDQKNEVADLVESINPENRMYRKIAAALRSPEDIGLDFLSPMYVFATSSIDDGFFLASVRNQDDVAAKLQSFSSDMDIDKDGNLSWIVMDGRVVGALTKSSLLIGSTNQKAIYRELLGLSGSESFFSTKAGKFLKKHSGDATVLLNMEALSTQQKRELRRAVERELDRDLRFLSTDEIWESIYEARLALNLECNAGKIALNLFADDVDKDGKEVLKKVSKDAFKQVPARDLVGLIAIGIDGEEVWKRVEDEAGSSIALLGEMTSVIETFATSTNGTAIVALSGKDVKENPEVLALIPTPKSLIKPIISLIGSELPKGIFIEGDKKCTAITNKADYDFENVKSSFDKASNATSSYIYGFVDAKPVLEIAFNYMDNRTRRDQMKLNRKVREFASLADYMELKVEDVDRAQLALLLNDKSKNSLALVLEHCLQLGKAYIEYENARRASYYDYDYDATSSATTIVEEPAEEVVAEEWEEWFE